MGRYTLDLLRRPVETPSLLAWARWMEIPGNKRVAEDVLPDGHRVSTVFLGLDHSFGGGPPVLFETMVFPPLEEDCTHRVLGACGCFRDQDCDRYCTWEEAEAGHRAMVERWLNGRGGYDNR